MMMILINLFVLIVVANGHLYLKSPLSRGVDSLGNELPLINQQGSGGYVDQYYYHGKNLFEIIFQNYGNSF